MLTYQKQVKRKKTLKNVRGEEEGEEESGKGVSKRKKGVKKKAISPADVSDCKTLLKPNNEARECPQIR